MYILCYILTMVLSHITGIFTSCAIYWQWSCQILQLYLHPVLINDNGSVTYYCYIYILWYIHVLTMVLSHITGIFTSCAIYWQWSCHMWQLYVDPVLSNDNGSVSYYSYIYILWYIYMYWQWSCHILQVYLHPVIYTCNDNGPVTYYRYIYILC